MNLTLVYIHRNTTTDVAAPVQSNTAEPLPTDPKDIIRHLERTSPETLALAGDWEDTAYALIKSKAKLEA
jgi:U3 small nucleolar RNA-associated protein 3